MNLVFSLLVAFLGAVLPGLVSLENSSMPLKAELIIEKTDLILQQNPQCAVRLTNVGDKEIVLASASPAFRIVEASTGLETKVQKKGHESWTAEPVTLKPNTSTDLFFDLLKQVPIKVPGKFDISVIVVYNAVQSAESEPVRVAVHAATPRALFLEAGNGGNSSVIYASWVNVATDPPEIVRTKIDLLPGGGIADSFSCGPAHLRAAPVLSAAANLIPVNSHYIGWIEKEQLKFVHADDALGVTPAVSIKLPTASCRIVEPLFSEPIVDTTARPEGGALVVAWSDPATPAKLFSYKLTPKGARQTGSALLSDGVPLFIQSFALSEGSQRYLTLNQSADRMTLAIGSWPTEDRSAPPEKLGDIKGMFISADFIVDPSDDIHGCVLAWSAPNPPRSLELVHWTLPRATGKLLTGARTTIEWDPTMAIESARVRAGDRGPDGAYIRGGDARWRVLVPEIGLKFAPDEVVTSKLPLDGAMLGGVEPVLVFGQLLSGLKVIRLDGSPLPHKQW